MHQPPCFARRYGRSAPIPSQGAEHAAGHSQLGPGRQNHQRLLEPVLELAATPTDEPRVLVEQSPQPWMVLLGEILGHDPIPLSPGAKATQRARQQVPASFLPHGGLRLSPA